MKHGIIIVVLVVAAVIFAAGCSQGSYSVGVGGGDRLSVACGGRQTEITDPDKIIEIADMFSNTYDKRKEAKLSDEGYTVTFYGYDDEDAEPLVFNVLSEDEVIYNGWKCKIEGGEIDLSALEELLDQ